MSAAQSLSHAAAARPGARNPLRELWHREPRLVVYTAILLAAMVPALAGLMLDERTLRDVNVWVKPMKFLISTVVLALTTAWFIGHLPEASRRGRAVSVIVWTLIATASFEIGYISLQAALGQASHYNVGDPFHGLMYSLMGIAAVVLAGTQPALALQLLRHGDRSRATAYRLSVLLGLTLSFVLGAVAGMVLAGIQPPAGTLLPVIGWSMQGGDLRVAHFIGIHAAQALPLAGAAVVALRLPAQRTLVVCIALAWTTAFAYSFVQALRGLPLIAA
jgi:hypothetical protein